MSKNEIRYLLLFLGLFSASIPALKAQDAWYDPMSGNTPYIDNRAWNMEIGKNYYRLPERAQSKVLPAVFNLSKNSAGLCVRFVSNAPQIVVRYTISGSLSMPHMPTTGVSGLDLYATDSYGRQHFCKGNYSFSSHTIYNYESLTYSAEDKNGYEYCLYLPLYNTVTFLQIGIDSKYSFRFLEPSKEQPIVVYGTSIAQGGCASRPGMAWTNILNREFKTPVINLGFSGNGVLESGMFELLSEIEAKVFILDCMPNMINTERINLIVPRLKEGVKILRAKSDAPILIVEHDGYMGDEVQTNERAYVEVNKLQREAFEDIKKDYKNVYYLTREELNLSHDSQVDGVHATDLGMREYADAYIKALKKIF